MSRSVTVPSGPSWAGTPFSASARISSSPVSELIGAASARHILMPLYWAGLWLAVNIAPGSPRCPEA